MKKKSIESNPADECVIIIDKCSSTIDALLKGSTQTIGRANDIKNNFKMIKNILVMKCGGHDTGLPARVEVVGRFKPITNFMGEKIELTKEEVTKDDLSPTNFNQFKNPDQINYKKRIYSEMFEGRLRNLLVQRLRSGVETSLRKIHDDEYARDNYAGVCEMIIKIHLFTSLEQFKQLAFAEETVAKYKEAYSWEFNFLKDVNGWIERGDDIKEIENLMFR
jgi:hypothetical protein